MISNIYDMHIYDKLSCLTHSQFSLILKLNKALGLGWTSMTGTY